MNPRWEWHNRRFSTGNVSRVSHLRTPSADLYSVFHPNLNVYRLMLDGGVQIKVKRQKDYLTLPAMMFESADLFDVISKYFRIQNVSRKTLQRRLREAYLDRRRSQHEQQMQARRLPREVVPTPI